MSPKWFGSGKSNASPKAMTIQELEKLLTKRQSGNKDAIYLKVDGNDMVIMSRENYDRIIKAVNAIERLSLSLTGGNNA